MLSMLPTQIVVLKFKRHSLLFIFPFMLKVVNRGGSSLKFLYTKFKILLFLFLPSFPFAFVHSNVSRRAKVMDAGCFENEFSYK